MEKIITYKEQGDGRDSWRIDEVENGEIITSYMVYEDPNKEPVIDINSLTGDQLLKLNSLQQF